MQRTKNLGQIKKTQKRLIASAVGLFFRNTQTNNPCLKTAALSYKGTILVYKLSFLVCNQPIKT
tara:strand:- start:1249 stop:1440 length:192 start_codon:yes stop_codon:yes gene_type:complete